MKSHSLLLILFLCIIHLSCKNDDDDTTIQEIDTSNLVNATATIAAFNTLATLDLETGTTLTTENDQLIANLTYDNSFIGLFQDRLVRSMTTDLAGEQIWEVSPGIETGLDISFNASKLILQEDILYLTYRATDPALPSPSYIIMAINAVNGDTIWTASQPDNEFKHLAILNNRIITVEGPQGSEIITSRNLSDGSIVDTWSLGERISHLLAGTNEVIIMSWSNAVYSIQEDLTLNWTFSTANANVQRGAIVGNQFLFHSRDQNIYAVNLQTGDLKWSQAFPDLFIQQFFNNGTSIWSVTQDFDGNAFTVNQLEIVTGTITSTFNIPLSAAADDIDEIEILAFSDYLLILTEHSGGNTMADFYNYKTQQMIWQSEIAFTNIFSMRANILLGTNRYTPTSF